MALLSANFFTFGQKRGTTMKTNLDCIHCIIGKAEKRYEAHEKDGEKKLAFMKKVFGVLGSSPDDVTSPYLSKRVNDLLKLEFGADDEYAGVKSKYNRLMLELEKKLTPAGEAEAALPVALRRAMVGNFIDFAANSDLESAKLYELIDSAGEQEVDAPLFARFLDELESAKSLTYILDNAGEIVFDKIFINTIKRAFPGLEVTAVARGGPVSNDATVLDAKEVGLDAAAKVIGNGNDLPGTQLDLISREARRAVDGADLIISKGQGNFETLHGCGKNIYYLFLCKCDLFVKRFGLARYTGVFANERDLAGAL